ncbi:MAG: DUF1772 domain-containing protein [Chloroflexi bacterium]|nr:DUF1772 domain-containing protein [Chloroflexota bacterium]
MYGILRTLHILFGIFVGGSYIFLVLILEPALSKLGPSIQTPLMRKITPIMTVVMATSLIIISGTGVTMIFMLHPGALNTLWSTAWGWDIIIGILATIGVFVVGFGLLVPTGIRLDKLGRSIEGRPPTPEEGQQLQALSERVTKLSRFNFIFVAIAIVTMVIAKLFM